jgi:hypothetical protein
MQVGHDAVQPLAQLAAAWVQAHTTLATLHARAAVLNTCTAEQWLADSDSVTPQAFMTLLRVLLFRGEQLPAHSSSGNSSSSGSSDIYSVMAACFTQLLQREATTTVATAAAVSSPDSDTTASSSLAAYVTAACLDDLIAAGNESYLAGVCWGARDLRMPDWDALHKPNVELARW